MSVPLGNDSKEIENQMHSNFNKLCVLLSMEIKDFFLEFRKEDVVVKKKDKEVKDKSSAEIRVPI